MNLFFKRGAFLLPFFFIVTSWLNATDLGKYYEVFYSDVEKYNQWASSDRSDYFKDVFISLYNLPHLKKRKFINEIDLKILPGYSNNESFGYIYIDASSRMETEIILYGIKKGVLSVNGLKQGNISVLGETGYTLLKCVLEKGVYFFSLRIDEKIPGIPIKALSSKIIKISNSGGFTKSASANIRLVNIEPKEKDYFFSKLFNGFCFPFNITDKNSEELFFLTSMRKSSEKIKTEKLMYCLYNLSGRSCETAKLKKAGFSDSQVSWWHRNFFEKEVCFYDRNK